MSNDQYLVVSYFVVGGACVVLALATYALLRRSFFALTRVAPGGRLGRVYRRLFLFGVVVPALTGFFSVSFYSCEISSYDAVVKDRSYLVRKNQEQMATTLSYTCAALLTWGCLVAIGFAAMGDRGKPDETC
ncbi:hypothetical protein JW916_06785 [Candidatus Sumerlaeota bacterium]|nr:hypothetical protein [Candidatus Sumerlaeota bacterium]